MGGQRWRALFILLSGGLLPGCQVFCLSDCYSAPATGRPSAARTIVTVVPSHTDGHVGTVVVDPDGDRRVLDKAYSSARIDRGKPIEEFVSSPEAVSQAFGEAIAALPRPPVSFTVYFDIGNDSISKSSMGVLNELQAEMTQRGNSEITVIGHTDRMGTSEDNDALSERRAKRVREQLIEFGIPAGLVSTAARGEREPVVPTADGVAEPRNRRVEINIR